MGPADCFSENPQHHTTNSLRPGAGILPEATEIRPGPQAPERAGIGLWRCSPPSKQPIHISQANLSFFFPLDRFLAGILLAGCNPPLAGGRIHGRNQEESGFKKSPKINFFPHRFLPHFPILHEFWDPFCSLPLSFFIFLHHLFEHEY